MPLTQARVEALARGPGVVLVCGRFEGVDERVIVARAIEEVSIGDYVLSGGEVAAMVLIDACVRLLARASWARRLPAPRRALLTASWNTRNIRGRSSGRAGRSPKSSLSGDHGRIAAWRRAEAERLTRERRPDLWAAFIRRFRRGSQTAMTGR